MRPAGVRYVVRGRLLPTNLQAQGAVTGPALAGEYSKARWHL